MHHLPFEQPNVRASPLGPLCIKVLDSREKVMVFFITFNELTKGNIRKTR